MRVEYIIYMMIPLQTWHSTGVLGGAERERGGGVSVCMYSMSGEPKGME